MVLIHNLKTLSYHFPTSNQFKTNANVVLKCRAKLLKYTRICERGGCTYPEWNKLMQMIVILSNGKIRRVAVNFCADKV